MKAKIQRSFSRNKKKEEAQLGEKTGCNKSKWQPLNNWSTEPKEEAEEKKKEGERGGGKKEYAGKIAIIKRKKGTGYWWKRVGPLGGGLKQRRR